MPSLCQLLPFWLPTCVGLGAGLAYLMGYDWKTGAAVGAVVGLAPLPLLGLMSIWRPKYPPCECGGKRFEPVDTEDHDLDLAPREYVYRCSCGRMYVMGKDCVDQIHEQGERMTYKTRSPDGRWRNCIPVPINPRQERRKQYDPMHLPGEPQQPIPNVTEEDVARVIQRDFPSTSHAVVQKQLSRLDSPRVKLAVLKLANGSTEYIEHSVNLALSDYRDVLVAAEYPKCYSDWDLHKRPPEVQQAVYEEDWAQYLRWLEGDSTG